MQLSKNALGNLINRYKAVLKKCHLLNTFGTLAVASCLGLAALGAVCAPMQAGVAHAAGGAPTFTPTLNGLTAQDVQDIHSAIAPPAGYNDISWANHIATLTTDPSSAYMVTDITGTTPASGTYLNTFTTVENGINKTYGVTFDTSNTDVTHPYTSVESVAGTPVVGDYTFRILDSSTADPTDYLYFIVKNNEDEIISTGNRTNVPNPTIHENFIGNSVGAAGGAIECNATGIATLTGDFIGNSTTEGGGAIWIFNGARITTLTGDFIGNSALEGGAIWNLGGNITTLIGDFIGNSASADGGAIWMHTGNFTAITGDFINNSSQKNGGAIHWFGGERTTITGDFIGNSARGEGGAINFVAGSIGSITGDFIANSTTTTGIRAIGGAIYCHTQPLNYIDGSFINNSAKTSDSNVAQGGAIYTLSSLGFVANNDFPNVFSGNFTQEGNNAKDYNAIYMAEGSGLTFSMNGEGDFTFNDNIRVKDTVAYEIEITGHDATKNIFVLNNTWYDAKTINLTNATLSFSSVFHDDGIEYHGSIDTANLRVAGISTLHNVTATGETTIKNGAVANLAGVTEFAAFSNNGTVNALGDVTFTNGYNSAATLNVGDASTAGDVTLAANQNMTIKSGGDLNVVSGTLDVSGGILTVDSGASTFATGTNGTLTAKASDFGTFGADGSFSRDGTDNVQMSLEHTGHLILTGTGYGTVAQGFYETLLGNADLFSTGTGTIDFAGVTLSQYYSLDTVFGTYGQDQELMAGTLSGNKNVSTSGIIANTTGAPGAKATTSSIKSGSTLSLRGNNTGNILLDEGSLTNEGTLNLGMAGATYSANFNGTLTTNGETTVLSHVIFDGVVTSGGTTVIENGAAFTAGLVVAGDTTTLKDSITGISTVDNASLVVDAAGKTVTTGDIVLKNNGELEVVSGTLNMTADLTFNGGTLRSTSKSAGGDIAQATAVFLPDLPSNFDGNIIVEQNAYTVLGGGDRAYAEKAFTESNNSWGTGVTAALFIATPQSLASTGSIKVDGSNTQLSAADSNNAVFKSNSLLVVDASGIGTSAAITATDGVLTVESSAKLHITGAANDSILTIVDGFSDGTSSVAAGSWEGDNLTTSTSLQVADVIGFDSGTGSYKVEVSAASSDDLRTIYQEMTEETVKLLTGVDPNDVDSYFAALLSDKLGKNAPKETTLRSEALLRIAQMAGVQSSGLNVGKSFFANVLRRMASFGLGGFAPQSQQLKREQGIPSGSSVENAGLSAGQNGQNTQGMKNGVALWVSPLYQYSNVHGVDVGAFKNGYETGLGGLTLGADYTFNDIFRVGLAFNVGAGYTESTGDFYNTNNDFDFWGLSLYGGLSKDNFTLMADVGYSSVFGELSQDTAAGLGFSTLKADTQSDVWTLGLTAAYTFKTDFMDITPHAGVRYMHVTTYGFDTKSNGVVQTHTAESSQDVWYFPVGVTFSKDIVSASGWIFTPKLDLGFIAAAGDLDARSVTSIPGVAGSAEYTMKNVDGFAFNGGLGFDLAHKENGVSVGVNYNVQASEHETSHMIFANFRYEF